MTPLVHPRLVAALTPGFYRQRALIEQNFAHEVGESNWQAVPGLGAVPCADGPAPASTEVRGGAMTRVVRGVLISLAGYFPQITEDMRITVGSEIYDILGIDHGVARANTQLRVEKVTA